MFDEKDPVYNGNVLLSKLTSLIEYSRSNSIPIIFIQHNGKPGYPLETSTTGWEIHQAITPQQGDIIIQKNTPDSFHETALDTELMNLGVNHLILSGIQTGVCVDTTCRRAFSMNYEVTLVKDAHSTWNTAELTASQVINHHNNVLRWFAETVTTEDLIKKTR